MEQSVPILGQTPSSVGVILSASSLLALGGEAYFPLGPIKATESQTSGLHFPAFKTNVLAATPVKRRGKCMSRRTGQNGHIEASGKWWVVRWWQDVPAQEKRRHMRAKICPISGSGSLSKSERERCAREIIAASGADTEEHFNNVVMQTHGVTFREQAEWWLNHVQCRKRKPIALSTLKLWEGCLDNWINPNIGDLPLREVNNAVLKELVAKMSEGGLSPKTITDNYVPVVKMVISSAVDEQGKDLHPRNWNNEFIDLPVVEKEKQNTPSFSAEVMTGLAKWKWRRERMIFIVCGAAGLRIGEALGIEIDKHISPDFQTLSIKQKVHHGRVEQRLKTTNGFREVDLHPAIAALLKEYVGDRTSGFLFCTRKGKPVSATNIIRRHLHKALKQLNYVNPFTGTHKAGNHAFRRFRNTYLRNYTECPEGLYKYWMGHAGKDMSDLYDKVKEDIAFRRKWAEWCGFGFELPSVVPNVPKTAEKTEAAKAA